MTRTSVLAIALVLGVFAVASFGSSVSDDVSLDFTSELDHESILLEVESRLAELESMVAHPDVASLASEFEFVDAELVETLSEVTSRKPATKKTAPKKAAPKKAAPKAAPKKAAPKAKAPAKKTTQKAAPVPRVQSTSTLSRCHKAEAAAAYAVSHVSKKQFGEGRCATFVGNALSAAGIGSIKGSVNACDKGDELQKVGFVRLPSLSDVRVGDVWLWSCVGAHPSGHLQIRTARGWTSDHNQARSDPWKGGNTAGSRATAYRLAANRC